MLAFFHWWLEQLAGLIPERLRHAATQSFDALVIEIGGPMLTATRRRRGRLAPLGRFAADDEGIATLAEAVARGRRKPGRVLLRPPATWPLHKRLTLPLAARPELRRILAYEMEHETPFTLDEIWWRHTLRGVDRAAKTLDIDISVLPRALVAPIVEKLRKAGLPPTAIDLGAPGEPRVLIPLADMADEGRRRMRGPALVAAAAVGLIVLATGLVFARQYQRLAAADAELSELKTSASEAAALRRRIDSASDATQEIAAAREEAGSPLAALAAATRLLPDDAYLTDFAYHHRRVTMGGLSPAAAGLVGLLANTPPFKEPALAAPVVRTDANGLESFTIKVAFGDAKAP